MMMLTEVEKRLQVDAQNLDRDFPEADLLERQILARVAITSREKRRLGGPSWPMQVITAAAVIGFALAIAFAVLVARSNAPVGPHPSPQPSLPPATPGTAVVPVGDTWFFSKDDGALCASPPLLPRSLPCSRGVLITHDGGQTWLSTNINLEETTVKWLDSQHIVVVESQLGGPMQFEASADGGYRWQVTRLSEAAAHFAPGATFFLNANEGWALCSPSMPCSAGGSWHAPDPAVVYHTLDSGAHWQQVGTTVASGSASALGLSFTDSNRGFISTLDGDGIGRLFVTDDGGHSWHLLDLPAPPGGWQSAGAAPQGCNNYTCVLLPAMFGKRGVLLVEQYTGDWFTYTTSDGGGTWANPRALPSRVAWPILSPWVAPADAQDWCVVDGNGRLYRTIDAGQSWGHIPAVLPSGYTLASVAPVGGDVLWGTAIASGDGARFPIRSIDGGASWSLIKLPTK